MLIVIWAVAGGGFFWPLFPIVGFAIALGSQARSVFTKDISEAQIQREIDRRQR